jgi:protein-tyrosine-phosphatase
MGKILFICRSNAGRSQEAEAFFNKYTKRNEGISAGTEVKLEGRTGQPPGSNVILAMDKYGINISNKKRKQVNVSLLKKANKIIILMEEDEAKEHVPPYFKPFENKIIFWDIRDMRGINDMKIVIKITEKIRKLTQKLIRDIG